MDVILVTGGAGYIGSHVCKHLAASGLLPVTYDNLGRGHRWAVQWGPLAVGELADTPRLREVMARYRPQAVIHLAAFAYVGESMAQPELYYRNNVAGSISLLEAMVAEKIGLIVFSSTCSTYGTPRVIPIPEDHPQNPVNPYGAGKQMVEHMLRDFETAHGLRSIALRYFNAAGADPAAEIGAEHDPETRLIPRVLQVVAGRLDALPIFGADYETPDGTCIRDYIHVSDLAEAHGLALNRLLAGGESGAFNLGNGRGFSIYEVVEAVRRVTGVTIPTVIHPRRPGDPPVLVGDGSLARRVLGWQPRRCTLELQVEDAWRWLRKRWAIL